MAAWLGLTDQTAVTTFHTRNMTCVHAKINWVAFLIFNLSMSFHYRAIEKICYAIISYLLVFFFLLWGKANSSGLLSLGSLDISFQASSKPWFDLTPYSLSRTLMMSNEQPELGQVLNWMQVKNTWALSDLHWFVCNTSLQSVSVVLWKAVPLWEPHTLAGVQSSSTMKHRLPLHWRIRDRGERCTIWDSGCCKWWEPSHNQLKRVTTDGMQNLPVGNLLKGLHLFTWEFYGTSTLLQRPMAWILGEKPGKSLGVAFIWIRTTSRTTGNDIEPPWIWLHIWGLDSYDVITQPSTFVYESPALTLADTEGAFCPIQLPECSTVINSVSSFIWWIVELLECYVIWCHLWNLPDWDISSSEEEWIHRKF